MERLVGEHLDEAILFGVAQQVFYSLDPDNMGKHVTDIPGLRTEWFPKNLKEVLVEYVNDGQERFLVCITPIFALDGAPFLFLYLKVDTGHAEAEKAAITRLFLLGSLGAIIVTSVAIFLIFEVSIFTRLRSLLLLFRRVEDGDLTVRPTGRISRDEIGSLQEGVYSMIETLQEMMTALQKSQKQYRAVVEDIPAMICRFLPDGTFTFFNNEYCLDFQKQPTELLGQNFFDGAPQDERERIRRYFNALSVINPIITYTQQIQITGQNLRWQQWTGRAMFNEHGEVTEYQALGRDITDDILAQQEKAELEKQLQKAQKLEAIGTLAGGIAHDFNNILGGIIGYTELLQDDIVSDSRAQHYLSQILKACHRAKALILQILTFSRQSLAERQPLELQSIVKETLKLLKATLPDTIAIRCHLESPSSMVLVNATQIHQMLMNLYLNAVRAMRTTGGILEVTLQELEITSGNAVASDQMAGGSYVALTVRDTGHGMTEDLLQKIFDPYFTTQMPYEGTGLGLSICLGIAKSHGGTITVCSTPGEGSAFTVWLPQIEQEYIAQDVPPPSNILEEQRHECILFVDDEAFLVEIAQDLLEPLGYRVVTTMSSLDALERFQAQPDHFDLVITDQTMPNMTGVELAARLLQIRPEVPIILCTGFSESLSEEQAKALGISEFILKPLSRQDLVRAIRNVLHEGTSWPIS